MDVELEDREDLDVSSSHPLLSLDEPNMTELLTLIVSALKEFKVRVETCFSISFNTLSLNIHWKPLGLKSVDSL